MNIALNREQEQLILSQLKKGKYETLEAVIRDALDLLAAREAEKERLQLEELRQKIDVGTQQIARGQVTDGEIVFERIKAKINREYRRD